MEDHQSLRGPLERPELKVEGIQRERERDVLSNLGGDHLARAAPGREPVDKDHGVLSESLLEVGGAARKRILLAVNVPFFPFALKILRIVEIAFRLTL